MKRPIAIQTWLIAACLMAVIAEPSPCSAQPSNKPRRTITDGTPGVNVFAPRRWGTVGVKISNASDQPAEVLSSHYFTDAGDLQFGRQLWIPPRAARESWYPVLPPEGRLRAKALPVKSFLIDRTREGETLIAEPGAPLVQEGLLPAHSDPGPITGLIANPDTDGALLPHVARVAAGLSPRLARIDPDTLPPTPLALQALDHLVVASDRITPTTALAIRQWLHAGGRLWVQLDRVSPETVTLLLGHDFPATIVDRVELTKWTILRERVTADPDDEAYGSAEKMPPDLTGVRFDGAVDTFEPPVEMVRIVAAGITPVHTVDGWPASFWMRSGSGSVLFTTLSPRGWVTPRGNGAPSFDSSAVAQFKESESLLTITTPFLRMRDAPPLNGVSLDPLLVSHVGYRIVDRRLVAGVLTAFCITLVAGSWWLNRRDKLAHMGWAGPVAGLVATGALVAAGGLSRSHVPPTIATVQFVEVVPGNPDAAVTGRLALYAPDGTPALGAEHSGVFIPETAAGSTRRMVHTDLDRWHWENVTLTPGLQATSFDTTTRLTEPPSVRVTFGPDGAIGTIKPGLFENLEDAILATPSSRSMVVKCEPNGGNFTLRVADRLPTGQYFASGVLTGDQQYRRTAYQQLLEQRKWPRYPSRPTLLAWANPLDLGFTFAEGVRRTGSALVAIPIEIDRPAPGTRVAIPSPFLTHRGVGGSGLTPLYNPRQNAWVERTTSARTLLRFQVPAEILPLQVERATLEIDLNAPNRTIEVFDSSGKELLATRGGLTGTVRIELNRAELLQPDATGGVLLRLAVGDGEGSEWKITDVRLELAGRIPEE